MPVNTENVKDALDKFTDDNFVGAKELLKQEIRNAATIHLQDKLGLKGSDEDPENEDPENEE